MTEELHTSTCESCGWPALTGTRRCPFCREPFPKHTLAGIRGRAPVDPLRGLALAWIAAMIPVSLLVLTTLGMPFALPTLILSFVPAASVWMLHRRVAARIERLDSRRTGRTSNSAGRGDGRAQSDNTSSDARRR